MSSSRVSATEPGVPLSFKIISEVSTQSSIENPKWIGWQCLTKSKLYLLCRNVNSGMLNCLKKLAVLIAQQIMSVCFHGTVPVSSSVGIPADMDPVSEIG